MAKVNEKSKTKQSSYRLLVSVKSTLRQAPRVGLGRACFFRASSLSSLETFEPEPSRALDFFAILSLFQAFLRKLNKGQFFLPYNIDKTIKGNMENVGGYL